MNEEACEFLVRGGAEIEVTTNLAAPAAALVRGRSADGAGALSTA